MSLIGTNGVKTKKEIMMDDLIEALQIMRKYGNPDYPTHCEHDTMSFDIDVELVSEEDKDKLNELGIFVSDEYGDAMFTSFKFGSC